MPKAGTYHKTAKAKIRWHVRQAPEGFLVMNRTTGIPLCGYWSSEAIALKNGRLHFGTEPSTPEIEEGGTPAHAQAPQAGDGTSPRLPDPVVGVPAASPGPERIVEAMVIPQREVPVESSAVALPEPAPERRVLSPQEARDLICTVFRAKRIQRPVKR